MDALFYQLRQYSIGVIVFSALSIISLILFGLGKANVFYSNYDPMYDEPTDWIVIQGVSGILSTYVSHVIWIISISVFGVVFSFWIFFNTLNIRLSIRIEKKLDLKLLKTSLLNFCTFCLGSILNLSLSNALIKNRKNNEYIKITKDF